MKRQKHSSATGSSTSARDPLTALDQAIDKEDLTTRNPAELLTLAREALAHAEALGDTMAAARCRYHIGAAQIALSDHRAALATLTEGLRACEGNDDRLLEADILRAIADAFERMSDYVGALEYAGRSITICMQQNDRRRLAHALLILGASYMMCGELARAMESHTRALPIWEELGNMSRVGITLFNIGTVQCRLGEWGHAREQFERCLEIYTALGERFYVGRSLHGIAAVQMHEGALEEAIANLTDALALFKESGNKTYSGHALCALGECCFRLEEYRGAVRYLHEAVLVLEETGSVAHIVEATTRLARAYGVLGKYKRSHDLLHAALQRAEGASLLVEQAIIHESLADHHEHRKEYKQAIVHLRAQRTLRREMEQAEMRRITDLMHRQLKLERARREDEVHRLKKEQLERELKYATREISAMALHLRQRNEVIEILKGKLAMIGRRHAGGCEAVYNDMASELESIGVDDFGWRSLIQRIDEAHEEFVKRLAERFPRLTPTELKVCSLLKANLSTKEIAQLLSVSVRSVEDHRYELRRKLGIAREQNLNAFIASL